MKTNKIVLFIVVGVIAAGFAATFMTSNSKSQNKPAQSKQDEEIPIVDIYAPEPDNPATKELQKSRGRKYDTGTPLEDFLEPESDLLDLPSAHVSPEPSLPIDQSELVAIGTITDSKAFLSNDRTDVYSEFTIQIEEVLLNRSPLTLISGSKITGERQGGRIRFSSGNILLRGISGRGFPTKQGKYILFLKWNEGGQDFLITTGYKIQRGAIEPLDGNEKDLNLPIYKNFDSLKNMDAKTLIRRVRSAILSSKETVK